MSLVAGCRVFVLYEVPRPDLWHERLIIGLRLCGQGWMIVLTPDRDVFPEQVSLLNDDLRGFRVVTQGMDLPHGMRQIAAGLGTTCQ